MKMNRKLLPINKQLISNSITKFLRDEKAQSEWGSIYLILIFAIAALLLISIIKPMFKQASKIKDLPPLK